MKRAKLIAVVAAVSLLFLSSRWVSAEDAIEKAGVGIGVSLGNILFLPIKAIEVTMGAFSGGLSYIVTGNADLTKQIWHDTSEGPYIITPELARQSVGQRPLLEQSSSVEQK